MKKTILLLTHSGDYYTIDNVERAVAERGCRPIRFNTDLFPEKIKLSIRLGRNGTGLLLQDDAGEISLNAKDIYSVWLRKIGTPHVDKDMDELLRRGCITESGATLEAFLDELDSIRWLDHRSTVLKAQNKVYQLRLAQSAGIKTPETLITNNPEDVRRFYRDMKENIVSKMLTPLTISMDGHSPFVYTNRIGPEDLNELESLRYSPMVFQECIRSEYELRIAYVDGRLLTGAIHTGKVMEGDVDWRSQKQKKMEWEPFHVHEDFARKVRQFMKKIGLGFGALDVMVTPGGEYVFLEVNPTGEWGMLERDLDLPISETIADALLKPL